MNQSLSIPVEQVIEARDSIRNNLKKFTFNFDTFAASRVPTTPPNFQRKLSLRRVKFYRIERDDDDKTIRDIDRVIFLHASFANNTRSNYVSRIPNDNEILEKRYVIDSSNEFDIWFTLDGREMIVQFTELANDNTFGKYGNKNFIIEMCYY
jgi:hypothetical protein